MLLVRNLCASTARFFVLDEEGTETKRVMQAMTISMRMPRQDFGTNRQTDKNERVCTARKQDKTEGKRE